MTTGVKFDKTELIDNLDRHIEGHGNQLRCIKANSRKASYINGCMNALIDLRMAINESKDGKLPS